MRPRSLLAPIALLAPTCLATVAGAVDLTVSGIEVTQAIQTTTQSLVLVAKNPTIVRVKVGVAGSAAAVPGVDAELRVYANGVEIPGSPFFSSNGPITAPLSPNSANENDTLNFFCSPPQSTDVDFVVTVNPRHTVVETNYDNNTNSNLNRNFQCRKMVEMAGVSVNYTPGGGQPNQDTIAPGTGDAFLRGIYKTGDWNYHRSPLGALTWTQNINNSDGTMLSTLSDIRNNQIPAAGYTKPTFIYGWLPGNPFSGNGEAIGIPGDAAFGNTETSRFQRTFAHEIGHCWGQQHNSQTIGVVGYDVINQLKDPLNLAPVMATTKNDVMVAGLLTNQAWVAQITFNDCINDTRSACTTDGDGSSGGGGASDANSQRCMRVAGVYNHIAGSIALQPSQRFDVAEPTIDDPKGDAALTAFDAKGRVLTSVRIRTGTARELCSGDGLKPTSTFYAMVPATIANREIAKIEIKDIKSGRLLARQVRSANAPAGAISEVGLVAGQHNGPIPGAADLGEPMDGDISLHFAASDPDGTPLVATILYSPDGGNRWAPVVQSIEVQDGDNEVTFPTRNLPRSEGPNGIFKLRLSDDLNNGESELPMDSQFGAGSPPDVHVISPNTNITVPQWSSVVLQASAWDMEDQLLPEANVVWASDLQGALGTGRLFTTKKLIPGTHTLTLTGTDLDGMSTSKQVVVTVTARTVRTADLNFDGVVDAADLAIMLGSWGTNDGSDLDLDGVVGGSDLAILLGAWS